MPDLHQAIRARLSELRAEYEGLCYEDGVNQVCAEVEALLDGAGEPECINTFDCNAGDHADCCPANPLVRSMEAERLLRLTCAKLCDPEKCDAGNPSLEEMRSFQSRELADISIAVELYAVDVRNERDEAREAARWLLSEENLSADLAAEIRAEGAKRYPWLAEKATTP